MEDFKHFGHEHTLAFYQDENEDPKPYLCNICTLPILSTPSYTCTESNCKFFLHKSCAHLPTELKHQLNLPKGRQTIYTLREKPGLNIPHCQICQKMCHGFTYFSDDINHYNLHPLCAKPVEIKSKHKSHNEHPLVAICQEISCKCGACGHKHKGFFFSCQECNFWIHQDCTLLPMIVEHFSHHHPLVLTYALFDIYEDSFCYICGRDLLGKGVYSCGVCRHGVHLSCATADMKNLTSETGQLFIHLPDEGDTFPSSTIRRLKDKQSSHDDKKKMTLVEEYHNHRLILHDQDHHDQELKVCNACIQPITSSPFWECPQPNCHFLLHNFCQNVPSRIDRGSLIVPSFLWPDTTKDFFFSIFPCNSCHRPCNGFGYKYHYSLEPPLGDLECASTPNTITHASHGQHVLFIDPESWYIPYSCCPDKYSKIFISYRCAICVFRIHIGCANLPKKVRHKFDKHDLELIFGIEQELECCFCEFCEEDIDQRYWFYHCGECDHSFHVKCIPSVGLLSKVKFGGTLNVSCHPDHPVALTRMLMEINHKCGYCKDTIKGSVDEMAFRCFECDFWIHFSCARECRSDDRSRQVKLWYESM